MSSFLKENWEKVLLVVFWIYIFCEVISLHNSFLELKKTMMEKKHD